MCTEFENSASETPKGIYASHLFLISFLLAKVSLNDLKAFFYYYKTQVLLYWVKLHLLTLKKKRAERSVWLVSSEQRWKVGSIMRLYDCSLFHRRLGDKRMCK